MNIFGWLKKPANTETATQIAAAAVGKSNPQAADIVRIVGSAIEEVEARLEGAPGDEKKAEALTVINAQNPPIPIFADATRPQNTISQIIDALVALYHALGFFQRKSSSAAKPGPVSVSSK